MGFDLRVRWLGDFYYLLFWLILFSKWTNKRIIFKILYIIFVQDFSYCLVSIAFIGYIKFIIDLSWLESKILNGKC